MWLLGLFFSSGDAICKNLRIPFYTEDVFVDENEFSVLTTLILLDLFHD